MMNDTIILPSLLVTGKSLVVHSVIGTCGSIFHVGNSNEERIPAI